MGDEETFTDDEEQELLSSLKEKSDLEKAIAELFKDNYKDDLDKKEHDIDLRTRLDRLEISSMATISFLQSIDIRECKNKDGSSPNLATGLDILSMSIKRHKISLEGKSRNEIVDLFKTNNDLQKEVKKVMNNV